MSALVKPDTSYKDDTATPQYPVSEAQYWSRYYKAEKAYEWNNGTLEEKPVSEYATVLVYKWFLQLIEHFLESHPIANSTLLEMGGRFRHDKGLSIRKPDIGIVLNSNPVPLLPQDASYKGTFDLCIEALSSSSLQEMQRDLVQKKAEYQAAAVPEYFILSHQPEHTHFYRLNSAGLYEEIPADAQGLIASEVLPGLQWRIEDLYTQPKFTHLAEDAVYQSFVLLALQQEKQARLAAEAELVRLRAMLKQQ